ncbi:unnamed protein product [Phytomonas sp. Hart1]|nr:unnamed protein product [Phytomonas sp. Hart1]|eukprot:CCW68288.1 unnamed protein product [Phytomonas sp. isolate Hart1]
MNKFCQINYILDDHTVIFVAICVVGVNIFYFDPTASTIAVPFMTIMCCVMVALNVLLKRVLNQARPPGALKESSGMPSNHAASLMFLSILACEGLQRSQVKSLYPCRASTFSCATRVNSVLWLMQGLILTCAIYGSALRVICGAHTAPQVFVGGVFGFSSAVLVMRLNYAGYTGLRAGGRIDEIGYTIKCLLLLISIGTIAFTVKEIIYDYKRYITTTKYIMRKRKERNWN